MNRADQAPEPSMEELLASIRLIISDADKKAPLAREHGPLLSVAGTAMQSSFGGDEVLDLTDELVFPDENGVMAAPPLPRPEPTPAEQPAPVQNSKEPSRATPPSVQTGHPGAGRQDHTKAPPPSRPVWSRRELPAGGAPFESPAFKRRQEAGQAKAPSKSWPEDIQMAVPEQGPVSLVSPMEQAPPSQDKSAVVGSREETASPAPDVSQAGSLDGHEEAAVAALAQKLARSAVGAMEANELTTAQQVDFEHIEESSKAEVTEKFADAIEREGPALAKPSLPSMLDEVLRQDFRHDGAESGEDHAMQEPMAWQSEVLEAPRPQAAPENVRSVSRQWSAGSDERAVTQSSPAPINPIAQAQALVPAPGPMPAQPFRSLEDAVREMLRPLLVQWLNDNMPRILETAIREEIAARGLIPGSDR